MSEKDLGWSADVRMGPDSRGCRRRILGRVWMSEMDLTVADIGEGPLVGVDSGQDMRLSPWTCNGLSGMSSLLFACDTPDAMGHV